MSFALAHDRLRTGLGEDGDRPDGEDPSDPSTVQAMPLVLHLPHEPRPERRDLLEAAAIACVSVCLDERAGQDTAFAEALMNWYGARIRKIARRARNKKWSDVQSLPGVTASVGDPQRPASVRAFPACPVTETPALINRLQIEGTDLPLPEDAEGVLDADDHPVVYVDASLTMTVGKAAAQVAHGSMLLAAAMGRGRAWRWAQDGFPLHVCEVDAGRFEVVRAEAERRERGAGTQDTGASDGSGADGSAAVVRDAGYTEVAPGSVTVVALDRGAPAPSGQ